MKLNKISLKDQKLFNQYLGFAPHELAAFSFTNIYIWRPLYTIEWVVLEKSLCVFFRDPMGCFMYLPPLAKKFPPGVIQQAFEIMDKVNIPLASGTRDYVPMDHYIVKDKDRDIHCVNPINIKNVLKATNMLG